MNTIERYMTHGAGEDCEMHVDDSKAKGKPAANRREIVSVRRLGESNAGGILRTFFDVKCRVYDGADHYWAANFVKSVWTAKGTDAAEIRRMAKEGAASFLNHIAPVKRVRGRFTKAERDRFYRACAQSIEDYNRENI